MRFTLRKAGLLESDGTLTSGGWSAVTDYARRWLSGTRGIQAERDHPELRPYFRDVRLDSDAATFYGFREC